VASNKLKDIGGAQLRELNSTPAESADQEPPNERTIVNPRGWRESSLLLKVAIVFA
jgi:hypothetical protein